MCRFNTVMAPSSLSSSSSSRLSFRRDAFPGILFAALIRCQAACSTSTETLHRCPTLLALYPRSPAQTARRGEVERTVTSGPVRVKHSLVHPRLSLLLSPRHAGAFPRRCPSHLDNASQRERLRAQAADETGVPDRRWWARWASRAGNIWAQLPGGDGKKLVRQEEPAS